MQTLAGKKILLGIGGGIAAYKCADLTRRLIERGAEVQIVMTKAAKEFITPLTMQAVSGRPVSDSLLIRRQKPLWAILSWLNGRIWSYLHQPPLI